MKFNWNEIRRSALWGLCGITLWYVSICLFTLWSYRLVSVVASKIHQSTPYIVKVIMLFMCVHVQDIMLSIVFAALLTKYCCNSKFGYVLFMIGATAIPMTSSIEMLHESISYYDTLPSWTISTFISDMIYIFVLLPLAIWLGVFIGKRLQSELAC